MVGTSGGSDEGERVVYAARRCKNLNTERAHDRYDLDPMCWLKTEREFENSPWSIIGIYHSHPDCGAYFSETDLKNSCPWYSFIVLSIQKGTFDHANSWLPNAEQTAAEKEELIYA